MGNITHALVRASKRLPGSNPGLWLIQRPGGYWEHLRDSSGNLCYSRTTDQFEAMDIAGWNGRNDPGTIDNGAWEVSFRPWNLNGGYTPLRDGVSIGMEDLDEDEGGDRERLDTRFDQDI